MTPMRPRETTSRTGWLTAAFWIVTALFAYVLLGLLVAWAWLAYLAIGTALTYLWWKRRHRRNRYAALFGATCAFFAVMALAVSGAALLMPVSLPVDSVGPRKVDCGSVLDPVLVNELKVTFDGADVPELESRPIPQSSLEQKCSNWLHHRAGRAAGLALIGLLIAVRATGHVLSTDGSRTVRAPARAG